MPTIGKHYDLDTDNTLSNNSDNTIASQKATKAYIDNNYIPASAMEEAATVAKTGDYNDLINKPTIPQGTVTAVVAGSTADKINVTNNGSTSTITINNVANATKASMIYNSDTRSTNENPQWYSTNKSRSIISEFKSLSSIGISGNGTYGELTTYTPWTDNSGGYPSQICKCSTTNKIFKRVGTSNTTWSDWKEIAFTDAIPTKTSDLTNDSGFLTAHQSIKTLKTDNTSAQTASSSETITGSGTISLHKVSKTGSYNDLLNKPTIDTALSTTSTNAAQNKIITTELNKKIQQNDILQDLNPHALQPRFRFFSSTLNNVLYRSDKRHTVTLTNFNTANSGSLFDMNFDSNIKVLAGKIGTVNITGSTYNIGMDYPYGWLYVSFYGSNGITDLSQISAKVYQDWSGHNTGWVDITNSRQIVSSRDDNGTTRIYTVSFYTQNYGLRQIEISIDNTNGVGKEDTNVWVTQIEFFCQRTGVGSFPILTKLGGTVNGNITIPTTDGSFVGNLTGNADTATKATKDADGNTISTTYLKSHQSIKTLKTDNTTTQTASASEDIKGSGTINLHKVSKTGSYNDLLDKPTIPDPLPTQTGNSGKFLTTNGTTTSWATAGSSVSIDNSTITKNGNDQLQTVGYKDVRTSNTLKTWTGTRAQYDAITTKDANTLYNIIDDTDTTASMLELLYPVGAVYIGTMDVCPLATLGIGSWEKIAEDQVLQGSSLNHNAGATIAAGLPNITGEAHNFRTSNGADSGFSGAFSYTATTTYPNDNSSHTSRTYYNGITLDASRSNSIYGNSDTVQPPAFVVNIWRRIS